jgi:hypothetical protein
MRLYRLSLDQPPRNTQARYNVCPTGALGPGAAVVEQDAQGREDGDVQRASP